MWRFPARTTSSSAGRRCRPPWATLTTGLLKITCCQLLKEVAAFIQQRIRHVYRRQRPTPLPSGRAQHRHQSQLGVDGLPARMSGALTTATAACRVS